MSGYNIIKPESISLTDDATGNIKRLRLHNDHLLLENLLGNLIIRVDNVEIDTLANRPAAGIVNSFYYATDTYQFFLDNGTNWITVVDSSSLSKVSVWRGSTNQSIADSTVTKVQFNYESYDTKGEFDSTTNYRFTCITAGYYLIQLTLYTYKTAAVGTTQVSIYKNGTQTKFTEIVNDNTNYCSILVQGTVHLDANDYIEGFIYQTSGAILDVVAGTAKTYLDINQLK